MAPSSARNVAEGFMGTHKVLLTLTFSQLQRLNYTIGELASIIIIILNMGGMM